MGRGERWRVDKGVGKEARRIEFLRRRKGWKVFWKGRRAAREMWNARAGAQVVIYRCSE